MKLARFLLVTVCCVSIVCSYGQSNKRKSKKAKTPVLFTVDKKPVFVDEFVYLYNKNHQAKPDEYTKESIQEYLRLFINFKVKVEEARTRGMDTTRAFVKEYDSYRSELLKPYLPDGKIIDSLVTLTYNRMKDEVRASHILIGVTAEASPEDTLAAYKKIMDLKKRLEGGEDFGKLAMAHSEDPSAATNQGDLGFFTALQMVYPFETAAYQTPVGKVSDPVRTRFGYHLLKVTDRQPARGEVEVSHIMIRTGGVEDESAKSTIFSVYDQLTAGGDWEELCRQYSQDMSSRDTGGRLRSFGVGAMAAVPEFEQAAFSLQKPGDLSDPFETAYGWHIVRLEKKTPLPTKEELAPQLKTQVARDERLKISQEVVRVKFRKEYQFTENEAVKKKVLALADSNLTKGTWVAPAFPDAQSQQLFSLQGTSYTVKDFLVYAEKNQSPGIDPEGVLEHLYEAYVDKKLMALVEQKVAQENPEFRMLLNEYYEGILLFEIMEDEVWNKAAADTVGLRKFYDQNNAKYQAGERVKAALYSGSSQTFVKPLKELINQGDSTAIEQYVMDHDLKLEAGLYEREDKPVLSQIDWSTGIYSTENNGMYYLAWIQNTLPPGPKTFDEVRAAVIADYQQKLEEEWVDTLKKKYPVKVNEKGKQYVLDKLRK